MRLDEQVADGLTPLALFPIIVSQKVALFARKWADSQQIDAGVELLFADGRHLGEEFLQSDSSGWP